MQQMSSYNTGHPIKGNGIVYILLGVIEFSVGLYYNSGTCVWLEIPLWFLIIDGASIRG